MKNNEINNGNSGDTNIYESGFSVNQYTIIKHIESGGMGDVYLAHDNKLKRDIALKFVNSSMILDSEIKNRFFKEAQTAAQLNHPNIITIFEVGEHNNRPFFAMEYIHGQSLEQFIKDEDFNFKRFLGICTQICEGLKSAHEKNVIHYDIKPSNILIDKNDNVKILDFGLSVIQKADQKFEVDTTSGTIYYMSPEQIQNTKTDNRSDLFSLGAVLYQLFTGQRPFEGDYKAAVEYSILNETPQAITSVNEQIPTQFNEIIFRLLEKIIDQRYQDIENLIEDIQKFDSSIIPEPELKTKPVFSKGVLTLGILLLVIIVIFLGWKYGFKTSYETGLIRKTIAVMPFENIGPLEEGYFANGITDAVTHHLIKFSALRVISRISAMKYKGSSKDIKEIGSELETEYILTGTIQKDKSVIPNQILIKAGLIDVSSNSYLWSDEYKCDIDRIFSLQSEIAGNVSRALNVAISRVQSDRPTFKPTENLEAYDLYLRGKDYFNRSWKKDDIEIAIELYSQAIELDTGFAEAYAMLSRGHSSMYSEYYDHTKKRLTDAKNSVNKALEINPDLAEGHLAMGYCYYSQCDYQKALEEFAIVEQCQPNNRYLYNAIGAVQRRQGNLDESVRNFIKALELDPLNYLRAFDVGLTYGMMRQNKEANKYLDRAITLAPDLPISYVYKAWLCILENGDISMANEIINRVYHKVDFSGSKYYWWLSRIIKSDYNEILKETTPGQDTAGYYLHCAQMYRLMNRSQTERLYSDSALVFLETKMADLQGTARYHSHLGLAYAGLRQKKLAITNGERAVELLPTSQDAFDALFLVINLAETQLIFDEYDSAIGQLKFLLTIPGFVSKSYLKIDPLWIPLREHPDFKRMVETDSDKII